MKLISCYVSGFGRLADMRLDLTQNPLVVKADNGWGKTTLAAFLESMFYGLEASRGKSFAENPRGKYEPWSGRAFGGSLVFETGGKRYRVERTFGKTPSADVAKIYDENNMPCYAFGEKAERLGETLFGVDRESYRKSAYIPQGETGADCVPDGLKNRLSFLLSANCGAGGAKDAIARLDEAERALRAKRKPAKGKLDELDERIETLRRECAECEAAAQQAKLLRGQSDAYCARLAQIDREIAKISRALEESMLSDGERAAAEQLRASLSETETAMENLRSFFVDVDPLRLNTDGLQAAVTEFYSLKEGAGMRSRKKEREKTKRRPLVWLGALLSFALFVFGAAEIFGNPPLGIAAFVLGGVFGAVSLFLSVSSSGKRKADSPQGNDERAAALEKGIREFLSNFRFEEIYDYRAALSALKERAAQYAAYRQAAERYRERLDGLSQNVAQTRGTRDVNALRAQKATLEEEKTQLSESRGRAFAQLAAYEEKADLVAETEAEETRLTEEKTRLERRLSAIRTAREILMRARENTASRYLLPVEKNCRRYAEILNGDGKTSQFAFSADGKWTFEESGRFRDAECYSAGTRELYAFCTRLALAEAAFVKDLPPLILDDPFSDMDDDKTERAKKLVRELSKKYHVVYFTCKKERTL